MHTSSYDTAVKFCREIGDRPDTDEETRAKRLRNAVLAFSVRHVLREHNAAEVNNLITIRLMQFFSICIIITSISN